jgi:hypothetical protein
MIKNFLIALIFVKSISLPLIAQFQLKGGEIDITSAGGAWYNADVWLLVEWPSAATKSVVNIDWGDGSASRALPFIGTYSLGYANSAMVKFSATHSFTPGSYTITVIDSFYITNLVNIPTSSAQKLILRRFFTTNIPPIYNTPTRIVSPEQIEMGRDCYSSNGSNSMALDDINGDSISSLVVAHPEIPGYVIPPATASWGLSFSVNVAPGKYNVYVRTDEWRHINPTGPATLLGSIFRDFFLLVDDCTGVNENKSGTKIAKVFPNPNSGDFSVDLEDGGERYSYEVYDITGKVITSGVKESTQQGLTFNLSGRCNKGLYLLKLPSGKNQYTYKVIIE